MRQQNGGPKIGTVDVIREREEFANCILQFLAVTSWD
jgi:hypothetical protein